MRAAFDLVETHPVTGRRTGLAAAIRAALGAMNAAHVPYAVIGATALAARGLPRMTQDLDLVVVLEDAFDALDALEGAGFRSVAPCRRNKDPEPMYVLRDRGGREVDLPVAAAEPESTVVAEASSAEVLGTQAPVATLEHLVLMYLYSNQARHLGDLARIVTETEVDSGLGRAVPRRGPSGDARRAGGARAGRPEPATGAAEATTPAALTSAPARLRRVRNERKRGGWNRKTPGGCATARSGFSAAATWPARSSAGCSTAAR